MAINLESLSPAELKALITNAESQMRTAHATHVSDMRAKIETLLKKGGLTMAEVFPTRGGKAAKGSKAPVAPKYRNPSDAAQTWSGRGKRPIWFVEALKKRGVTADNLLIDGAQAAAAPVSVAKKAPTKAKAAKKAPAKKKVKA